MGAELSTLSDTSSDQTSTTSRGNSTRSTSTRHETRKKSREVLRLVRSLEVRSDYFDDGVGGRRNGVDDEGDADAEENERGSCHAAIINKCTHLQSEMKILYSNRHHPIFTPYELCQIILKLLTLLSATVTIEYVIQPISNSNSNDEEVQHQVKTKTDDGRVKTKTDDGSSNSPLTQDDLDISTHQHFDWGEDTVEQIETKVDDGRPSLQSHPSSKSIDELDISSHEHFDWGEDEDHNDETDDRSSGDEIYVEEIGIVQKDKSRRRSSDPRSNSKRSILGSVKANWKSSSDVVGRGHRSGSKSIDFNSSRSRSNSNSGEMDEGEGDDAKKNSLKKFHKSSGDLIAQDTFTRAHSKSSGDLVDMTSNPARNFKRLDTFNKIIQSPFTRANKSSGDLVGAAAKAQADLDDSEKFDLVYGDVKAALGLDTAEQYKIMAAAAKGEQHKNPLDQRLEQIASAFQDYLELDDGNPDDKKAKRGRSAFYKRDSTTIERKKKVSLQFDNMGYIVGGEFSERVIDKSMMMKLPDGKQVIDVVHCGSEGRILQDTCGHRIAPLGNVLNRGETSFALPHQAREAILSVLVLLLNKRKDLESMSNSIKAQRKRIKKEKQREEDTWWLASLFGSTSHEHEEDEWMLILNWQPLLRLLIRTVPVLETHNTEPIKMGFLKRQGQLEKKTVILITSARKFFDQGIRPKGCDDYATADCTARQLWHYVKRDLTPETHPNSYFRALVLLYLFHPTGCSQKFYLKHMRRWMDRWSGVNQTPEIDFLWVVMFCRARRCVGKAEYDYGWIKRHLEQIGPMLEDDRWNDTPARRMSGASSVMDFSISMFDELNAQCANEDLDDIPLDDHEGFRHGYNGEKEQEMLPETIFTSRSQQYAACSTLFDDS